MIQQPLEIRVKGTFTKGALSAIATASGGHLRDAIQLLERVIMFSKNITIDDVEKVLGVTSYNILFDTLDSVISKNETNLIINLDTISKSGMDLKLFCKNFLSFVLDVNKYVTLKTENIQNIQNYISIPSSFENRLMNYNASHKNSLKSLLKTLIELNSNLRWETTVKPVLETALLEEVL